MWRPELPDATLERFNVTAVTGNACDAQHQFNPKVALPTA